MKLTIHLLGTPRLPICTCLWKLIRRGEAQSLIPHFDRCRTVVKRRSMEFPLPALVMRTAPHVPRGPFKRLLSVTSAFNLGPQVEGLVPRKMGTSAHRQRSALLHATSPPPTPVKPGINSPGKKEPSKTTDGTNKKRTLGLGHFPRPNPHNLANPTLRKRPPHNYSMVPASGLA